MSKPRLLDLYCGQGGAAAGYAAAGFEVVGVDLDPQPRYPFTFVRADAVSFARYAWRDFDAIHASPPCQRRTKAQRIQGNEHPRLIEPTRDVLRESGLPYVIENVPYDGDGEDDDPLIDPITLCGQSFGLHTYRHREFETNFPIRAPGHVAHRRRTVKMGRALRPGDYYHAVGNFSSVAQVRDDMGVPWMSRDGIRECIPPAYGHYVGQWLTMHLVESRPVAA